MVATMSLRCVSVCSESWMEIGAEPPLQVRSSVNDVCSSYTQAMRSLMTPQTIHGECGRRGTGQHRGDIQLLGLSFRKKLRSEEHPNLVLVFIPLRRDDAEQPPTARHDARGDLRSGTHRWQLRSLKHLSELTPSQIPEKRLISNGRVYLMHEGVPDCGIWVEVHTYSGSGICTSTLVHNKAESSTRAVRGGVG